MRILTLLLGICSCLGLYAQSAFSFEPDSTRKTSWQTESGDLRITNLKMIGMIPFTATQGNYFADIENDSTATNPKGQIKGSFTINEIPRNISFDYFYLPATNNQYALFQYAFFKSGDTLSSSADTLHPIFSGTDTIALKWNNHMFNLPALSEQPDSLGIRIIVDNTTPYTGKPVLLIDNIQLGKWFLGVNEIKKETFLLYPNPAKNFVKIVSATKIACIKLRDISGKEINQYFFDKESMLLDIRNLTTGIYYVEIENIKHELKSLKLVICNYLNN